MEFGEAIFGDFALEGDFESFTLTHIDHAINMKPTQGGHHCTALWIQDFWLEHDVHDDVGR